MPVLSSSRAPRRVRAVLVAVTPPGETEVTAPPGGGAVYAEGAVNGAVGVPGLFRFEVPGTDDVVAFVYGYGTPVDRVEVDPGDTGATLTWAPTSSGPQYLTVQAVDAAGNVGPARVYAFVVGATSPDGSGGSRWTLDEGAGTTATDTTGEHVLTLTPTTTWTAGLWEEILGQPDGALLLDEPTDGAVTAGPLVDTTGSWSLAAFVRADNLEPGTVVSQDGGTTDAFRIGTTTTDCPDDLPVCWVLTVTTGDARGGDSYAPSTVPVVPGTWVALFAVRDAGLGVHRLDVCTIGTADTSGDLVPVRGQLGVLRGAAPATGVFRLGGGQDGTSSWRGAVSGLQTWSGVIDETRERRLCASGGA